MANVVITEPIGTASDDSKTFAAAIDNLNDALMKKIDESTAKIEAKFDALAQKIDDKSVESSNALVARLKLSSDILDATMINHANRADATANRNADRTDVTTNTTMDRMDSTMNSTMDRMDSTMNDTMDAQTARCGNEMRMTRTALMSVMAGLGIDDLGETEDYNEVLRTITGEGEIPINPASILYALIASAGDAEEIRNTPSGNPIANAIRELAIRMDVQDERSKVVQGAVRSKKRIPSDIDSSIAHQKPQMYSAYVKAQDAAKDNS